MVRADAPDMKAICLSCNSSALKWIGAIPSSNSFAGRILPHPLSGGSLLSCDLCLLYFRFPQMCKADMDALYRKGASINWQHQPSNRKDWQIAGTWIREHCEEGAILDCGCFDGQFLSSINENYDLFGIEIHQEAAQRAVKNGIRILGSDFSDVENLPLKFDVVVAIDVIEHMSDPIKFLEKVGLVTKPGGVVIIASGNTQAFSWRMMGSRYWYCTIAEHVSFISPQWCERAALKLGFKIEEMELFSHSSSSRLTRIVDFVKNAFYRFFPRVAAWLRVRGVGHIDIKKFPFLVDHPPLWGSATDHMICLLRKL